MHFAASTLVARAHDIDAIVFSSRLKRLTRCGCKPCAAQIRWTERSEMPVAAAIARPVHGVASPGGSPSVRSTTRSTTALGSGALPGGRLLSRSSPSAPSAMNRSCHRHTVALAQPLGA
jgi:hypothetical protein